MQFKRKRICGKTQKTYKEWQSDCGHYRICWRNEISGLGSARYYAAVRCDRGDDRSRRNRAGPARDQRNPDPAFGQHPFLAPKNVF